MSAPAERRDRILVVDDSPEALGFLTRALEQAQMTALVATSGMAALEIVGRILPDLILMDAVMPGLSGFDTTERLKRSVEAADVPVIFMTGLMESEHVLRGLAAGAVDYVTKPIVIEELLARIRVHLANARVALGARTALDATGRSLLSLDAEGRILWSTPRAARLLAEFLSDPEPAGQLPPEISARLSLLRGEGAPGASVALELGARRAELTYLNRIGPDEFLYRLSEDAPGAREALLREAFGLTQREAEVLLWISAGKSNRDAAEILGISPRTVNKHLDQVFTKLGAENRATAAAMAVRLLAAQG